MSTSKAALSGDRPPHTRHTILVSSLASKTTLRASVTCRKSIDNITHTWPQRASALCSLLPGLTSIRAPPLSAADARGCTGLSESHQEAVTAAVPGPSWQQCCYDHRWQGLTSAREGLQPLTRAILPVAAVSWLFTHLAAAPFLLLFLGISISLRQNPKTFNSIYRRCVVFSFLGAQPSTCGVRLPLTSGHSPSFCLTPPPRHPE